MTPLSLHPPGPQDAAELLAFELANRAYFERLINARPAGYYSAEGVAAAIEAAQSDAAEDRAYQFLVRDAQGALVARVNLHQVRRQHFHSAELGYRVAEAQTGRGIAKAAVAEVLLRARDLELRRLEAHVRPENLGSCAVLRRNGFEEFGRSRRGMELAGHWYDVLYFERHLDAGA
jgi:ribosomal-protein-alanine N-acetyltransferase